MFWPGQQMALLWWDEALKTQLPNNIYIEQEKLENTRK
jgi:hypothetical protein